VVLVVAAVVQFLSAGSARETAAAAAQAGAVALLQDGDPQAAVEDALGDAADRSTIVIDGHRVKVTVRPRAFAPPVADWLEATATADASEQAPVAAREVIRGGDGESSRPAEDGNEARTVGRLESAPEAGP
jgi:hypothetical protein